MSLDIGDVLAFPLPEYALLNLGADVCKLSAVRAFFLSVAFS